MHCAIRDQRDRKFLFHLTGQRVDIVFARFNLAAGDLEVLITAASRQTHLPAPHDAEPHLYEPFQSGHLQANSNEMSFAPSHSTALPNVLRFSSPEVSVMKWLPATIPIFDAKQTPP